MNKIITILLFVLFGTFQLLGQHTFSKEQIQEDLDFLKLNLQKYHPNLFVYSTEEEIDAFFKNLNTSLPNNLDVPQSFNVVSSISSIVKDGHFVVKPGKKTLKQFYTTSKLFPLDIHWIGEDAYVTRNYSDNDGIVLGSKIFAINKVGIDEIRETILDRVLRDGNNETYPEWILNNFLRAYYNFCFGNSDVYKIELGANSLDTRILTVNGLQHKEISKSRKEKYPEYAQGIEEEKGLELKIKEDSKLALLTIRSFDNNILKKTYGQKFKKSIKDFFKIIEEENIKNLVIDLRGNQGGELKNGVYLLRYLLKEDFQAVQKFTKTSKANYKNPKDRNKEVKRIGKEYNKPFEDKFEHNLYTLINGGSFSCSGIVSWVLKKYKRGILLGKETGGSAYTLVGEPNKEIVLPNTQLQITIPTREFILQDYENKQRTGVIPDVMIEPSISEILNNKDVGYEYIMKLLLD